MSIGILAVAFVSLFALLPVGMTGFRQSIDSSNETWIMQSMSSMVQTTDWEKLWGPNATISKDIYYFDEEGRPTDTEITPSSDPKVKLARIYGARLFVMPQSRPAGEGSTEYISVSNSEESDPATVRVIALIGNVTTAKDQFLNVGSVEQVVTLPATPGLTVKAFVVSRMNAVHNSNLNN